MDRRLLAVTGMLVEARIAGGAGVVTLAGGGDAAALARGIEAAIAKGVTAVISFGISGALDPALRPGCCIVARGVIDGDTRWAADPGWADAIARRVGGTLRADIAGVDRMVLRSEDKSLLFAKLGAAAVDMETHVVARLAAAHGLPFAAFRVVSDPAWRSLPPAAVAGLRPDGRVNLPAVVTSLLRNPAQLRLLAHTALDAQAALRALRRGRRRLGHRLGFGDFDELALDVL